MNVKNILTTLTLFFMLSACTGGQTTPTSVSAKASVVPIVLPTETSTLTPTPIPTNTPTPIPTPIGGRNGLLLEGRSYNNQSGKWNRNQVYLYDMLSQETSLLFEGYRLTGVSNDGNKFAMEKLDGEKSDLFIVDLASPDEPVLLHSNIVSNSSIWLPESKLIGFISIVDGIPQVFIIHADGSNPTQLTNSTIGAAELGSVLNDGVFWMEGKIKDNTTKVSAYKWTKLDGVETRLDGPENAFKKSFILNSAGKYVFDSIIGVVGSGCTRNLYDLESGETKEISFTQSNPDMKCHNVWPISDDLWLIAQLGTRTTNAQYWFYSSDGTLLKPFAELPFDHDPSPNVDNTSYDSLIFDYYMPISPVGGEVQWQRLSPDGNLLLLEHFKRGRDVGEFSYYLLNVSTFVVEKLPLPSLMLTYDGNNKIFDGNGSAYYKYFWVEIP